MVACIALVCWRNNYVLIHNSFRKETIWDETLAKNWFNRFDVIISIFIAAWITVGRALQHHTAFLTELVLFFVTLLDRFVGHISVTKEMDEGYKATLILRFSLCMHKFLNHFILTLLLPSLAQIAFTIEKCK